MARINAPGRTIEAPAGTTIQDAVSGAGLRPDSYLFLIDGVPVPMDRVLEDEEVRALRVASGG